MKYLAVNVDELVPLPGKDTPVSTKYPETGMVSELPHITLEESISISTQTILGWAMIFTVIALVVAGFYYLQARGKEEDIKKSKDILLYLVIGMAIMAAAYGVVAGIAQFEFF